MLSVSVVLPAIYLYILFSCNPPNSQIPLVQSLFCPDPSDYCENLKVKLAQLMKIVDANMVQSSSQQQLNKLVLQKIKLSKYTHRKS